MYFGCDLGKRKIANKKRNNKTHFKFDTFPKNKKNKKNKKKGLKCVIQLCYNLSVCSE